MNDISGNNYNKMVSTMVSLSSDGFGNLSLLFHLFFAHSWAWAISFLCSVPKLFLLLWFFNFCFQCLSEGSVFFKRTLTWWWRGKCANNRLNLLPIPLFPSMAVSKSRIQLIGLPQYQFENRYSTVYHTVYSAYILGSSRENQCK